MIAIRDPQKEQIFFVALTCAAVAAIAILSFMPGVDKSALHTEGRFHSVGHLLIFSAVAFIGGRTSRSPWVRVAIFLGLLVFGFGTELAEHLKYQSILEWNDVLVDSVGTVFGTAIAWASAPKRI